jgi:hypothetical protein
MSFDLEAILSHLMDGGYYCYLDMQVIAVFTLINIHETISLTSGVLGRAIGDMGISGTEYRCMS